MKHKLLITYIFSYLIFALGCILAATFLPIQEHHILFVIAVFVLSLIPSGVFYLKFYCPLIRITRETSRYTDGSSRTPLDYSSDDELGALASSVNFLADSVCNTVDYQRKFISNISHDFRSPLTSIKGYVEAILDGTIPVEMQDRYLNIVVNETERLNKLTEGLLLLNTFDDGGVYLDYTDFDLIPVIQNSIDALQGLSDKKNLKLIFTPSAPVVRVRADISKIQQVLYNLLDNAIKFSDSSAEILIRIRTQKNRVFVSVKDNGCGISKDNLPKIWDRFYKTDASRGRDKKGTGLGLSIVREIIRAHGQNIDVISTEGAGTEFVFTLDTAKS